MKGAWLLALALAPLLRQEEAAEPVSAQSLFAVPLFLEDEPPECRSAAVILIGHAEALGAPPSLARSRDEARDVAAGLVALLRGGADFAELARRHSDGGERNRAGVLGTLPPGVLEPESDAFLFAAEVGEVSEPVETARGFCIWKRLERYAACRQIVLRGDGEEERELAQDIARRARDGEDFAELARTYSQDERSASVGGAWRVFERGPDDRLLKLAAFQAEVGEVFGPLQSPLGFHVGQRVPLSELSADRVENNWVRGRALLVSHADAPEGLRFATRTGVEARLRAYELDALVRSKGESFEELAARFTDEPTARERSGDLGWLHRWNPRHASVLNRLFSIQPGMVVQPLATDAGWVILQRTR